MQAATATIGSRVSGLGSGQSGEACDANRATNTQEPLKMGSRSARRPGAALFADDAVAVSSCGFVTIPAHHLRWARIPTRAGCTAKIHAAERTITLTPTPGDHFVGQGGAIDLARELNAMGVCPDRCTRHAPGVERVRRDHHRELVIRFAPEAMKPKALKTPDKSTAKARRARR